MAKLPCSQRFDHQGRSIAWREYGSGPRPIVLTHGLLMDGRMFAKLAPALADRGYRVITVDMLGHGDSGPVRDMTEGTSSPTASARAHRTLYAGPTSAAVRCQVRCVYPRTV
jgi:pimeloyl-ACP methyl ester carboxylesterase